MCIRDRPQARPQALQAGPAYRRRLSRDPVDGGPFLRKSGPVSYTHLRAHETVLDLVCRLLLEKKKNKNT